MKRERVWSIVFIVVLTGVFLSLAFNNNAWEDEIYSMRWTALSWSDMMRSLAGDVHPPLYYIMLKVVNGMSGNNLIVAKIFSVIPMGASLWIGGNFIKKEFGKKSMIFYCLFLSFIPCVMEKTVEVRMYTWGILFCILAGIYMYKLMQETSIKNWAFFVAASLLAAYNHYYGVATMIFVYLALFVFFVFTKRIKEVGQFLLCSVITVIGYLPWLPTALKQITAVNGSYWITLPSSRLSILRELFEGNFPNSEKILLPLVLGLTLYLMLLFVWKKKKELYWALAMCAPLFFVFVLGQAYGMLVKPVLVSRYLILSLGIMVMGLSVAWKYIHKYVLILPCVFIVLVGAFEYKAVYEAEYNTLTKETIAFAEEHIKEGDTIVWDIPSLNNSVLYYIKQATPTSNTYNIYTEEYDKIWYFSYFTNTIDLEALTEKGIHYTNLGDYGLDNVYFTLYLLSKER